MKTGDVWTWPWQQSVPVAPFADMPAGNRMGWRVGLCGESKRGIVRFAAPTPELPKGLAVKFHSLPIAQADSG
ncbi:MAG: hypothetical protein PHD01_16445 [Geobacteraceae bacterium]|nr:hypothetical protein [Geobacteraceae bacterium]